MLEAHFWIPGATRDRLESGWAHVFRTEVLDMIPESAFASLYHATNGRPNTPVSILVSLSILKEMLDLTDEALMESFYFDLRFHHALRLPLGEVTMAIRTLYNFRNRVVGTPAVMTTFNEVTKRITETLSLHLDQQRLDSTHICSNMATLTRLGLFTETIESFLARLRKTFPDRVADILPTCVARKASAACKRRPRIFGPWWTVSGRTRRCVGCRPTSF
jgi:hypothetical protein